MFYSSGLLAPSIPSYHNPYPNRLADALERLLAPVLEPHAGGRARQRAHGLRHQHLARRRQPRDPRGYVHRAAVDVVLLPYHISGVEAEVEGQPRVVTRRPARQRRLDRLAGAGEDGEDAVAEELA